MVRGQHVAHGLELVHAYRICAYAHASADSNANAEWGGARLLSYIALALGLMSDVSKHASDRSELIGL
jgi:hypothetical protein